MSVSQLAELASNIDRQRAIIKGQDALIRQLKAKVKRQQETIANIERKAKIALEGKQEKKMVKKFVEEIRKEYKAKSAREQGQAQRPARAKGRI